MTTEKMEQKVFEYSVCADCLVYIANGDVCHEGETEESMARHIDRELDGKNGRFVPGLPYRVFEVSGYNAEGYKVRTEERAGSEGEALARVIAEEGPAEEGTAYVIEDITEIYETTEFDTAACDLCRSSLSGSRHAATLIIDNAI